MMRTLFLLPLLVCLLLVPTQAQAQASPGPPLWQVTLFDINATVQQAERTISGVATISATNVGGTAGRVMTVRLSNKASVKSVAAGGAASTFRPGAEPRGDLQRFEIALPSAVNPGASTTVTVNYTLPVEINSGLAAISPIGTQFLPGSFWYPMPNTPYTLRGADTAPFRLTVNIANAISSGVEKSGSAGSISFDQSIHGQPFFLQGDWDKVEGTGDGRGVVVLLEKGATAEDRKRAEALIAFAGAARSFFATLLGPAPDVPLRIVSVRRGAGFNDSGTVLIDADTLRLAKIDAATALSVAETIARLWVAGQTPVRGEGNGVLRDGLVRYLATQFLEKQFGRDAVLSEFYRQRLAYAAVAQRDAPLARSSQIDSTYFGSVPNRGAMFWRLVDRKMGRDVLIGVVRTALEAGKKDQNGTTLTALREALIARGGEAVKPLLETQLDQVIDTDLMVGLPTQRGSDWVSALRNIGSIDVAVTVAATTDRGERVLAEATVPAKNFGEAVFKTTSKIVRVEVDPDKLYPQLDYGNDAMPRSKDLPEALNEASLQLGAQDYVKAEATARAMIAAAPRFQDARSLLARALLGQNKLEEAEQISRALLEEPLPFTATLAWANIVLGEISLKRNQAAEAAKRFNDAVVASRDYPSSLAARAARIRAEAAANAAPAVDEAARAFITQFSQAVVSNKKAELDSRVVSGELVRFINASIGTELWETRVLRTELLNANLIAADVYIKANKLGKAGEGTAVMLIARTPGGLKVSGIELFEVR